MSNQNRKIVIPIAMEYEKQLEQMVQDYQANLTKIENSAKKIKFSKDLTDQIDKLKTQLDEIRREMSSTFEQIGKDKLDISSFNEFRKSIESQFNKIQDDVKNLNLSLSNLGNQVKLLDGANFANNMISQFNEMKVKANEAYKTINNLVQLVSSSSNTSLDKIEEYTKSLKKIRKMNKETANINFSSLNEDELFEELTKQEELLEKQIKLYEEIKSKKENLIEDDSDFYKLENKLIRIQSTALTTAEIIAELDAEIEDRNLGAGMENDTKKIISSMSNFEKEIDDFTAKAKEYIEVNKKIQDSNSQMSSSFNTFQIKNGAIHVPVEIATRDSTLENSLTELVERLQKYAESNPIITQVKLQLDQSTSSKYKKNSDIEQQLKDNDDAITVNLDKALKNSYIQAVRESEKVAKDAISEIQKIFKENPIAISVDKEKFAKNLGEVVDKSLSDISKISNVDISETVFNLVEAIKDFKAELSSNENFTFGIDENSINRITSAIENMANMIQRAFDVVSDYDIQTQFAKTYHLYSSIPKNKDGTIIKKNKDLIKEFITEYQHYLDMSKKEADFSVFTIKEKQIKQLIGLYDEYKDSILDTNNLSNSKNTVINLDNSEFVPSVEYIKEKLKEIPDEKNIKVNLLNSQVVESLVPLEKISDLNTDSSPTTQLENLGEAKEKVVKANKELSTIAENSTEKILAEGEAAEKTAKNMQELAEAKEKAVKANELLKESADETKISVDKEGKSAKNTDDAIDQLVENRISKNAKDWDIVSTSAERYKDILGEVYDVYEQYRRSPGKNEKNKELLSYRIVGETGNSVTINPQGQRINSNDKIIDDLTRQKEAQKEVAKAAKETQKELEAAIKEQEKLNSEREKQDQKYWQGRFKDKIEDMTSKNPVLVEMSKYYSELEQKSAKAAKDSISKINEIQEKANGINISFSNKLNLAELDETNERVISLTARFEELKKTTSSIETPESLDEYKQKITSLEKELNRLIKGQQLGKDTKATNLLAKINDYLSKNTKLSNEARGELNLFVNMLKSGSLTNEQLEEIAVSFNHIKSEASRAGETGLRFFDKWKKRAESLGLTLTTFTSFYKVVEVGKKVFNTVKELDTALVDVKKTFKGTDAELEQMYKNSSTLAKELGVTTEEIIKQEAAWSRLGYSTKEQAETMAKLSSQFAVISPGMDIDTATDGLVSTMKAYGIEVDDVQRKIMDNTNRIGNTMATSNEEIVDMLTRSSAAMAAANNSIEETIALESAAVEITRNAETTGTAFKTLSMRLRGYDEETEELSDDLKNISGDIADLTKVASNNNQGVSLFKDEAKTEYKSTYEILRDISKIWDELTDKNQAQLLEKLAGKRGGQVVAGLLSNFESAEKAMKEMENAAGSSEAEMSIVEESIEYKLNRLSQTWVETYKNMLDRGDIGEIVDGLNSLSKALGFLIEHFGKLAVIIGGGAFLGKDKLKQRFCPLWVEVHIA